MSQLKNRKEQIKDLFEEIKGVYGLEFAFDGLGTILVHERKFNGMMPDYADAIWLEIYEKYKGELKPCH